MENKILELIKLHTNNLQKATQMDLSLENEQKKLAKEIVKLFAIPNAQKTVCPNCGEDDYWEQKDCICQQCGHSW